jgi:hypothetical protein
MDEAVPVSMKCNYLTFLNKIPNKIPIFITKITIFSTISSKPYYMANLISVDGRL